MPTDQHLDTVGLLKAKVEGEIARLEPSIADRENYDDTRVRLHVKAEALRWVLREIEALPLEEGKNGSCAVVEPSRSGRSQEAPSPGDGRPLRLREWSYGIAPGDTDRTVKIRLTRYAKSKRDVERLITAVHAFVAALDPLTPDGAPPSASTDAEATQTQAHKSFPSQGAGRERSDNVWHGHDDLPAHGSKIVAIYLDGSGANLFYCHEGGFIDAQGDELTFENFANQDFWTWAYLRDDFTFWCETTETDPYTLPIIPRPASPNQNGGLSSATDDRERGVHMAHCNQGLYAGSCKYGEQETCPALNLPVEPGQ